jgi:16S rRNA A1518/A1519 N6-dimethyltransferase RsmA/KsgA/DIM1 with predicted DNA glycosylase/AP lyase activity
MSLRMLGSASVLAADALIDVGGGASPLTRALLDRGFRDLTVLDISRVRDAARPLPPWFAS